MLLLQNLFCRVRLYGLISWLNKPRRGQAHTPSPYGVTRTNQLTIAKQRLAPGAMKPFKYLEHSSDPNKPSKRLDITLQLKKIQVVRAPQLLIATKVAWDRGNNEVFKALRCITNFDNHPWFMLPSSVWLPTLQKYSGWRYQHKGTKKKKQKEGYTSD